MERFLALFPCTCVLKPTLGHFYKTSLLFLGPLFIVASAYLKLLYSLLNREHFHHSRDIPVAMQLKFLQKQLHAHVYCRIIYNRQAIPKSQDAPNLPMDQENIEFMQWNFTRPQRSMTFWHSQENGWD
jgi:hypothetical protein